MILAIDMGNTNIVIGGIDETKTYLIERVTTDQCRTDTEYAVS
ncbi:MAG: type III pantothenate kinase [Enterocloster bolteae]